MAVKRAWVRCGRGCGAAGCGTVECGAARARMRGGHMQVQQAGVRDGMGRRAPFPVVSVVDAFCSTHINLRGGLLVTPLAIESDHA